MVQVSELDLTKTAMSAATSNADAVMTEMIYQLEALIVAEQWSFVKKMITAIRSHAE
jgi:hypothetical protein